MAKYNEFFEDENDEEDFFLAPFIDNITHRLFGEPPYTVMLLHGGPGVPGELGPVALTLEDQFGIIEAFQTKETIEGQIEEHAELIETHTVPPITLVGYDWGAWLGCLVAARYPELVKKLILVSANPFEVRYLHLIAETREKRIEIYINSLPEDIRRGAETLEEMGPSMIYEVMEEIDHFDMLPTYFNNGALQPVIFMEIVKPMEELRAGGSLMAQVEKIQCPVTAIHGDYDSRPVEGVQEPLSAHLDDFKFILLEKCGDQPWHERFAKEKFYQVLRQEIAQED